MVPVASDPLWPALLPLDSTRTRLFMSCASSGNQTFPFTVYKPFFSLAPRGRSSMDACGEVFIWKEEGHVKPSFVARTVPFERVKICGPLLPCVFHCTQHTTSSSCPPSRLSHPSRVQCRRGNVIGTRPTFVVLTRHAFPIPVQKQWNGTHTIWCDARCTRVCRQTP